MNQLKQFQENAAQNTFGMTREEAWEQEICINCKKDWKPRTYSNNGKEEYKISALCEYCYDEIMGG